MILPFREEDRQSMKDELLGLLDTMGVETVEVMVAPLREPSPRYLIGAGKAREIWERAQALGVDLIVIDGELSPSQQRNWENDSGLAVIDRHEVILEIFAQRAHTHEATLQVALARLEYSLPRLTRKWTELSQQRGGAYTTRGAGETQLEMDRRAVQRRIDKIRRELAEVQKHREVTRKSRKENLLTAAAIVGYTNAGKSTLLKTLTGAEVLVEDRLFATLDPVTRRYQPAAGQDLLLTDTVGFVSRLPHQLVAAFRSTLEASLEADFLIHVADASESNLPEKIEVVNQVLRDLGRAEVPRILVLNKIDRLSAAERRLLEFRFPDAIQVSLHEREGLDRLDRALLAMMERCRVVMELALPPTRSDLIRLLHHQAVLLQEEYRDDSVYIKALGPSALKGKLRAYLIQQDSPG